MNLSSYLAKRYPTLEFTPGRDEFGAVNGHDVPGQARRTLEKLQAKLPPRKEKELIADYVSRLEAESQSIPQMRHVSSLLRNIAACQNTIDRLEREAKDQAEREERWRREKLERDCSIDQKRVKQLVEIVDEAEDAEDLLSELWGALQRYSNAQAARKELDQIFTKAEIAAAQLGRKAPKRPQLRESNQDAASCARLLSKLSTF